MTVQNFVHFILVLAVTFQFILQLNVNVHFHTHPKVPTPINELDEGFDDDALWYKLVLFWPNGTCMKKESACLGSRFLQDFPKSFTIHGLWPIHPSCENSKVEFVDNTFLQRFTAADLVNLQRVWPKLSHFRKLNQCLKFWKQEWDRHGKRCDIFMLEEYFAVTVELFEQITTEILDGVRQTIITTTTPSSEDSFKLLFKHNIFLLCVTGVDGRTYLSQLTICFNKHMEEMNCDPELEDKKIKMSCAGKTIFYYSDYQSAGKNAGERRVDRIRDTVQTKLQPAPPSPLQQGQKPSKGYSSINHLLIKLCIKVQLPFLLSFLEQNMA